MDVFIDIAVRAAALPAFAYVNLFNTQVLRDAIMNNISADILSLGKKLSPEVRAELGTVLRAADEAGNTGRSLRIINNLSDLGLLAILVKFIVYDYIRVREEIGDITSKPKRILARIALFLISLGYIGVFVVHLHNKLQILQYYYKMMKVIQIS